MKQGQKSLMMAWLENKHDRLNYLRGLVKRTWENSLPCFLSMRVTVSLEAFDWLLSRTLLLLARPMVESGSLVSAASNRLLLWANKLLASLKIDSSLLNRRYPAVAEVRKRPRELLLLLRCQLLWSPSSGFRDIDLASPFWILTIGLLSELTSMFLPDLPWCSHGELSKLGRVKDILASSIALM